MEPEKTDCIVCQKEPYFVDSLNELSFCSYECQSLYHRFDRSFVLERPWNKFKVSCLLQFFTNTGMPLKYLYMCQLLEVDDIKRFILQLFIGETLSIFQTTSLATSTTNYIYMLHGGGLISRIGDNKQYPQYKREFGAIEITASTSASDKTVHIVKRHSIANVHTPIYMAIECGLKEIGEERFTQNGASLRVDNIVSIVGDKMTMVIRYKYEDDIHCLSDIDRGRPNTYWDISTPKKPLIIAFGSCHMAHIAIDGSLWVSGSNLLNRCGFGLKMNGSDDFLHIETNGPCIAVACGTLTTMYVSLDGSLWGTGNNSYGELGLERLSKTEGGFHRIPGLPPVCAVSCGYRHSMVIDINGCLWATGDNVNGQLGTGDTNRRIHYTLISLPLPVISVYCGHSISIVTLKDDSRWAAGTNTANRIGIGNDIIETNLFVPLSWMPPLSAIHKKKRIEL